MGLRTFVPPLFGFFKAKSALAAALATPLHFTSRRARCFILTMLNRRRQAVGPAVPDHSSCFDRCSFGHNFTIQVPAGKMHSFYERIQKSDKRHKSSSGVLLTPHR
jgi:hypothetical protein